MSAGVLLHIRSRRPVVLGAPSIDLHLLSWPESLTEAERIAGPGRAAVVRPLIDEQITRAPRRAQARVALELAPDRPVILVSGGGWGVGDLAGAAAVALATVREAIVVCLAGRGEKARRHLQRVHGEDARVRILGFTERMPELLAAADVLIHTTGGTTALEARTVGCRLINYDTRVAHVRAHARALHEQGLALWARDRRQLAGALARSLAQAPPPPLQIDALPEAASLVLQLARGGVSRCRGQTSGAPPPARRPPSPPRTPA